MEDAVALLIAQGESELPSLLALRLLLLRPRRTAQGSRLERDRSDRRPLPPTLRFLSDEGLDEGGDVLDRAALGQAIEAGHLQVGRLEDRLITEDLTGTRVTDQAPSIEDHRAMGVLQGEVHVVGDEEDGEAKVPVQVGEELHQGGVAPPILARRRLVEDQEARVRHQDAGDGHPLLLPVAEGTDGPPMILAQRTEAEHVHHAVADLLLPIPLLPQGEGDLVVDDIAADHMVGVLHDEADERGALACRVAGEVHPIHDDLSTVGGEHPHQETGERRLARSVGAEDRDHLPASDRQAHVVERLGDAVVGEAQGLGLEQDRPHLLPLLRSLSSMPRPHLLLAGARGDGIETADVINLSDGTPGEVQGRQIERLPDPQVGERGGPE